jgi:hypothetical protein
MLSGVRNYRKTTDHVVILITKVKIIFKLEEKRFAASAGREESDDVIGKTFNGDHVCHGMCFGCGHAPSKSTPGGPAGGAARCGGGSMEQKFTSCPIGKRRSVHPEFPDGHYFISRA